MQSAGTLDKDYVLVEHGFEYMAKDGSLISIKPHERYLLLRRTNEHWWQVSQDLKSKPFYIPAKYVKVLSSISRGSYVWERPEDLAQHSPSTQYSYAFLAAKPHHPGAQQDSGLSTSHKMGAASAGNVQLRHLVMTGSSRSLLDLSQLNHNPTIEQRTSIEQDRIITDHKLGPLKTFHNSKKVLDPLKQISLMCPPDLQPRIRPSQSLNDLQLIKSTTPTFDPPPLERGKILGIQHHMEEVTVQQDNMTSSDTGLEKVVTEEASSPIYANLENFRRDGRRQSGSASSQRYSSSSAIEDWERHTDTGSGHVFYYNSVTGETTWDCPFDHVEETLQSPVTPSQLTPPPAERNWEKHFDETSGNFYFYNSVTGATTWDPPKSDQHSDQQRDQHSDQLPTGVTQMFSSYGSVDRRPPTPEADYPDYSTDHVDSYPEADYDGHYIPPPPTQAPTNGPFSAWSCQIKDGQKFYTNDYSGEMWLQSEDLDGKTYFYTPDGSNSQWKLPELGPLGLQSNLDQNSNVFSGWQHNLPHQKDTEIKGLVKAGVLHKTKTAENGKRLRKNWSSSWTVLEGGILTFFKDTKNLSSNSLRQSLLTVPEHTVQLQGATLSWATRDKSSKKHVMELKTREGSEYLIHHDSEAITKDWFTSISKSIGKSGHISSDYTSENENESLSEFGSTEKLGKEEKKSAGQNSDSDRNVRAKLKKLLQRRPTLQSLRDKGYIRDQVFGCHLHQLCEREKRDVPEFVSQAIEVVERRGLDIDGLYRISGNLAVIQKLRYKVDHGESFSLDDGRWEDVHVITGALKLFFRELPEPLFPYSHYERLVDVIKFNDQNQKIRCLKELILSLPKPNLETTRVLFRHLCRVIDHKDENRMSVQSVAIVFGPTLLRTELEGSNIAMNMVYQNQIVEQILIQYKFIYS